MTLPDKLELLARIIRENLPWEGKTSSVNLWTQGQGPPPVEYYVLEGYDIRIKQPPSSPVWIPLTPDDVPPGSVVRWIGGWNWVTVLMPCHEGLWLPTTESGTLWKWSRLAEKAEILRPGGVWEPCMKLQNENKAL